MCPHINCFYDITTDTILDISTYLYLRIFISKLCIYYSCRILIAYIQNSFFYPSMFWRKRKKKIIVESLISITFMEIWYYFSMFMFYVYLGQCVIACTSLSRDETDVIRCVCICFYRPSNRELPFKPPHCENVLSQISHMNSFSPACILICVFINT